MKYRILSFGILLLAMTDLQAQTRFGVTGGVHMAHISTNDDDINDEKKGMAGYQLGVLTDVPLGTGGWSFQPRLMLQLKGTGISHGDHTDKLRFTALDIPLSLQYRSKSGFFVAGGPNLGFNLAASEKHDGGVEKLELGSDPGQLNRTDIGLDLRTGVMLKSGLSIGLNYVRGFSNIQNTTGLTWNNHLFGLQVGYLFAGKK
jgi:hypothetical protein